MFAITEGRYPVRMNSDAFLEEKFGEGARLAEWNNIKARYQAEGGDFLREAGLTPIGEEGPHGGLVTRNGQEFWGSGDRHFRIDWGQVHSGYASHDRAFFDGLTLHLGSWYTDNQLLADVSAVDGFQRSPATSVPPTLDILPGITSPDAEFGVNVFELVATAANLSVLAYEGNPSAPTNFGYDYLDGTGWAVVSRVDGNPYTDRLWDAVADNMDRSYVILKTQALPVTNFEIGFDSFFDISGLYLGTASPAGPKSVPAHYNAPAILSVNGDTLSISFRGTDNWIQAVGDGQAWTPAGFNAYYNAMQPLIDAVYAVFSDPDLHPELKNLLVTGHSLGGAVVDAFSVADAFRFREIGVETTMVSLASPGLPAQWLRSRDFFDERLENKRVYDFDVDDLFVRDRLFQQSVFKKGDFLRGDEWLGFLEGDASLLDSPATPMRQTLDPSLWRDGRLEMSNLSVQPVSVAHKGDVVAAGAGRGFATWANHRFDLDFEIDLPNLDNSDVGAGDRGTFGVKHAGGLYKMNLEELAQSPLAPLYNGHHIILGRVAPVSTRRDDTAWLDDFIYAHPSEDSFILTGAGFDTLLAGMGNDLLYSSSGNNDFWLYGNYPTGGGSEVWRMGGNNIVQGGNGQDTAIFLASRDQFFASEMEAGGTLVVKAGGRGYWNILHDIEYVEFIPPGGSIDRLSLNDFIAEQSAVFVQAGGRAEQPSVLVFNGSGDAIHATSVAASGSSIIGFGVGDRLIVDASFGPEQVSVRLGSVILDIDTNNDGMADTSFTFGGRYLPEQFDFVQTAEGTEIMLLEELPPTSISGLALGLVIEDNPEAASAEGMLKVTDPYTEMNAFADVPSEALVASFGIFSFDPDTGAWTYKLDNDADAVQALPEGLEVTDSLTVNSLDGTTSETITITIRGVNDPASISGDVTGAVTEGDPDRQQVSGLLTVADPDADEDRFREPEPGALQGVYGSFAFDSDTGAWTYTLDNDAEAVQALSEGVEVTDSLTVTSLDGTASETVTVTIQGTGVRIPEPGAVVELSGLITDRAGEALEGALITFTPQEGSLRTSASDGTGRFALELNHGLSGNLDARRDYDPITDGSLTARDALDVLRLAVGIAPSWGAAQPMDFIAADINQDGQVTAADALDVLRAAVGIESANQPRWVFLDAAADLSDIDRTSTTVDPGVRIEALTAGLTEVTMTGVLLGSMQEYA